MLAGETCAATLTPTYYPSFLGVVIGWWQLSEGIGALRVGMTCIIILIIVITSTVTTAIDPKVIINEEKK